MRSSSEDDPRLMATMACACAVRSGPAYPVSATPELLSQVVIGFCFSMTTIGFAAAPFGNWSRSPCLLRSRWLFIAIHTGLPFGSCWAVRFARGSLFLEYRLHSPNTMNGTSCHYEDFYSRAARSGSIDVRRRLSRLSGNWRGPYNASN